MEPFSCRKPNHSVLTQALSNPQMMTMPSLSPTMSMGNIANWVKKEGDAVRTLFTVKVPVPTPIYVQCISKCSRCITAAKPNRANIELN